MKRIPALIIALTIGLYFCLYGLYPVSAMASSSKVAAVSDQTDLTRPETTDNEIMRGIAYGFVTEKLKDDYNKTITFAEYSSMLSSLIKKLDASRSSDWQNVAKLALTSSGKMRRDEGMLALYEAACVLGKGAEIHEGWLEVHACCGEGIWDELKENSQQFSNWNKPSPFEDIPDRCPGWNYIVSSYFYSLGSCSKVNGKALFDCDVKNATMRVTDPFTRGEAIRSVVRFYENDREVANRIALNYEETDWQLPLLSVSAKKKEAIMNNQERIVHSGLFTQGKTYTGAAYYISNSGNDLNDGRSPEKAWATLNHISGIDSVLKPGDAVFFERGGTWYVHNIMPTCDNITYSAYGEGPKPIINGSESQMADHTKWKLHLKGEDGAKIWVYYRNVSDVSGILFDDNASWAEKTFANWNGKNFVGENGKNIDIASLLKRDLTFFSAIDLSNYVANHYVEDDVIGPLYLRCDGGNPGEVYHNIEMIQRGAAFGVEHNGVTIDNLSIRYAALGINCGLNGSECPLGTLVQNCEIGWCSGNIFYYNNLGEETSPIQYPWMSGAAILMSGCNHSAINNYIHDCDNKVFNIVINDKEWIPTQNITMRGNLLDHNGSALHLCFYVEDQYPDYTMKNIAFEDNDVLYTGYGWFTSKQFFEHADMGTLSAFDTANCYNRSQNVSIHNNLFYLAHQGIIHSYNMWGKNRPVYSGNTYVQNVGDSLIFAGPASSNTLYMDRDVSYTQTQLKKILGDTSGRVILK